ncbi:MAG: hypothetical protein ACLFP1_08885 [Candidatus Goldiibacteriota bacterium]
MSALLLSGTMTAVLIFTIMGTGWIQFASRYSLDYQIFIILFGLFALKKWQSNPVFNSVMTLLLVISIYMNYFGMRYYYML